VFYKGVPFDFTYHLAFIFTHYKHKPVASTTNSAEYGEVNLVVNIAANSNNEPTNIAVYEHKLQLLH